MSSASLADILSEPQRHMVHHLRRRPKAIAFVGMGVGKTAATLAALEDDMVDGRCGKALVVAPLRVATCTWPAEVARWTPWMRVCDVRSPKGYKRFLRGEGFDLAVVNWDNLDKVSEYLLRTRKPCVDTIIFDELSCAKGHDSKRPKRMAAALARNPAIRRWGLTGTLLPNGPLDLWGQVRLIDGGERLGTSFTKFRERYFYPTDYMQYNWAPRKGAETTHEILGVIADMTLTIQSKEWLGIQEPLIEDVDVALPEAAWASYRAMEKDMVARVGSAEVEAPTAAVVVNKLLQFASGAVYDSEREVHAVHEAKVEALRRVVASSQGENLLVAANYQHEYERILALPGAVPFAGSNPQVIDDWNAGKIPLLVAHPKSIGHGLNLQHGGRTVVWFSPTWSQELYDQFNARVARRGQTKQPRIVRIVAKGTIDEAVLAVLEDKTAGQNMAKDVLQALHNRL